MKRTHLAAALLLLAGCSTLESVTEKHRARAEPQIAAITALASQVGGAPVAQAIQPAPSPAPVFMSSSEADTNAIIVLSSELSTLGEDGKPQLDIKEDHGCTRNAASLLKRGRLPDAVQWEPDSVDRCFEMVERLRYVLVLRTTRLEPVKMVGATGFTGGYFDADALLFDLAGQKYLGGFQISAQADETVQTFGGGSGLEANFWVRARDKVRKEVQARVPGAKISG